VQFFPGDPRNQDPQFANRVHDRLGDPRTRDAALWARGFRSFGATRLEALIGLNRRNGQSAALWRRPSDDATVRSLYPTGFLPLLDGRILDLTVQLGGRGSIRGWEWEAAAGYGSNTLRMELENTANASLGILSATSFFAGTLRSIRLRADARVRHALPGRSRLTIGGQVLSDGFRIAPGDRDSYRYGGVPIQDGPNAGGIPPVGAQGYPGFMPRDSGHTAQESLAGYVEAAARPLRAVTLTAAGRVETYTGASYGTLPSASLAAVVRPAGPLTLRGELAAGYRAPSEAERQFTRTLIPVINGVGLYDLVVPTADPVALALGSAPLRPERSTRWGAGLDLSARGFTFSLDYSDLRVRHQVTLTESFSGPGVRFFLESQGFDGIGAVRFLANVGDIRNRGVELRAGYETAFAGFRARVDAAFSHFETEVTRVDSIAGFAHQFQSVFFGPRERAAIESGQPRDNALAATTLSRGNGSLALRVRRYGSVLDYGPSPDGSLRERLGAKWLADVEARYAVNRRTTVSGGVQNLLGTRPDRLTVGSPESAGNSYFGIFPYSSFSPFGWNGRFAYAQVQWQFAER
jgi:iron complex outermembrane receptor protein